MSNIDAASSNVFSQFLFTIWTDPNIEGVVYDLDALYISCSSCPGPMRYLLPVNTLPMCVQH